MTICPTCGQAVLVRHGVKLQPRKAAILDLIERATGRGGVSLVGLAATFYPDVSTATAKQRIKVHISQINGLMISTDYRVVKRAGLYRLEGAS